MKSDAFRAAAEAKDFEAAEGLFREDVVFRSPFVFRPYEGLDALRFILTNVAEIFENFRYIGQTETDDFAVLMFEAELLVQIWFPPSTTGLSIDTTPAPDAGIRGLAFDGSYLWCSCGSHIVVQDLVHRRPIAGFSIDDRGTDRELPSGLAFVNDRLWYVDARGGKVVPRDPECAIHHSFLRLPVSFFRRSSCSRVHWQKAACGRTANRLPRC